MAQDDLFKALADANRRKILRLLSKQDSMTAGEIADQFTISKPAISDHLKVLRNAGLIYADKQGQFIHYQLNTTVMQEAATLLFDLLKINKNDLDSKSGLESQKEEE
jgi:ArsR family transcriptional regulator, arsenate/arsenite/antimonite-responsive transcriptional repressor